MCKGLLGKKLGMTAVFTPDGSYVPVTVVQAGPCVVTQIKTKSTDGYNALQLGFNGKKESRTTKPLRGHFGKSGGTCFSVTREFGVEQPEAYELGQVVNPEIFEVGEEVDVSGATKGRGFSGVMKRHKFSGGRKTHGSHSHRIPGSIGCSAWPSKVIKGKKMPGRYGVERKTIRNIQIVDIRAEENLILLKGAVPGPRSAVIEIRKRKFAK
jgi:large subunit ribosomal protein L3